MKKFLFLILLGSTSAIGQVLSNQPVVNQITDQNPFLDASTSFNGPGSIGKGLVFPQTDLTTWTFDTSGLDGINFPSAFDGMIVYNTASGSTLENQGQIVSVTPGFYYFSNPGATDNITNGQWIKFEAGAAGGKFVDGADPADAVYMGGKVGIGTTTPSGKLTIKGDDAVQIIENESGGSKLGIYYRTPNTSVPNLFINETSKATTPQISFNLSPVYGEPQLFLDSGVLTNLPSDLQLTTLHINNNSGSEARTLIQTEAGGNVAVGGYGNNDEGFRKELKEMAISSDVFSIRGRAVIQEIRDYENSFHKSAMALSFPNVTTAGFLPPRLTTVEMQQLTPVPGLMVYNLTINCMMYFDGSEWRCDKNGTTVTSNVDPSSIGVTLMPSISECFEKVISVSGCSSVPNAVINDNPDSALGIEYDWSDGMASMGVAERSLVEIGGQCWFRFNSISIPSNYPDLPNTGANIWNLESDFVPGTYKASFASWGYYNTVQENGSLGWGTTPAFQGDGLLYQYKAAMNGATQERTQGVCPTGFHVPSDCEFTKLETYLGMNSTDSNISSVSIPRGEANDVGTKLRGVGTNFNGLLNSSGFNLNTGGYRVSSPSQLSFNGRNFFSTFITSTLSGSAIFARVLIFTTKDTRRAAYALPIAHSLRCLKD